MLEAPDHPGPPPQPGEDASESPTAKAGPVSELERALTHLIRRAILPTNVEAVQQAAGVHLERSAYAALVRIDEHRSLRLSELATLLGVDDSTASRHITRLEEVGYVTRTRDPDDGRARRLVATPDGTAALSRVREARRQHLLRALAAWDTDDLTTLATMIVRLVDCLDQEPQ